MVRFREGASFGARPIVGRQIAAVMMSVGLVAGLRAQGLPGPITRVSMDDAVRLTLGFNQALRAQRLTIDMAKADETTAEQRPKFNVTFGAEGFPTFSQRQLTLERHRKPRLLQRRSGLHLRAWRQARQAHHGRQGHHRGHPAGT